MTRVIADDHQRHARGDRVAVVDQLRGAAGDAGPHAGGRGQRRGVLLQPPVERPRAGSVEGVAGDDEHLRRLTTVVEVDDLPGPLAPFGGCAVESGEDEVTGVEDLRRGVAQGADLAGEPRGRSRNPDAGAGDAELQRARRLVAAGRGRWRACRRRR